jgi:hypothetical protein
LKELGELPKPEELAEDLAATVGEPPPEVPAELEAAAAREEETDADS